MTVEADRPDPIESMLAFFGSEALRLRTKAGDCLEIGPDKPLPN
ncbi:hypothetical protein ACFY1P_32410 [Streptomyces sp. NPDC001407]